MNDILNRIQKLESDMNKLKSPSTIPLEIENALRGRGFLKSDDFIISGQAQLGVDGTAYIPIGNVSINSIAFAVYSDGTGSDIGSVVINNSGTFPNTIQLYLDGIGTKTVYYVIFKTANKSL